MFKDTVDTMVANAAKKVDLLKRNPLGYFVASMLAGIFVGFGIILIFSVAAPLAADGNPLVKLVMGASFGIALSLVIFAGSELFTGNAMVLSFGFLAKKNSLAELGGVWGLSWLGNLAGALLLALVAVQSGALNAALPFFAKVAAAKMAASPWELVLRGILCNTLVCLAVWTAARATSDSAKLILIWWCLFGFIGSGYEHSIANMTLLAIAVIGNPQAADISWSGYFYNIGWVTLGNTIAAVLVMALPYHLISWVRKPSPETAAAK